MPIEIRELQIKVVVGPGSTAGKKEMTATGKSDQEKVIKATTEKVLDILKSKKER